MSENIHGKVVVITGASSGLGAETARHLAREGAKVVLGARRLDRLEALASELGLDAKAILQTDVTDRRQVKALVDRAVELHGRIDVLLNNAGLMPSSMLDKLKIDDWDRMIDVNIKGVLYGIGAALPHMQAQKGGQIINVSSVAGHKVGPGGAVYAGTKWAVRAISEGLRQEVKPWNIRTTIVSPGAVATELTDTITDPDIAAGMAKTYERRFRPARSRAWWRSPSVSQKTLTSTKCSSALLVKRIERCRSGRALFAFPLGSPLEKNAMPHVIVKKLGRARRRRKSAGWPRPSLVM